MEIKINGKNTSLNFGIKFVRLADKAMEKEIGNTGVTFSQGLTELLNNVILGDLAALCDLLYCATWDNSERPSLADIEHTIEEMKFEDLEKFTSDLLEEVEASNAGKLAMKRLQANQEAGMKMLQVDNQA